MSPFPVRIYRFFTSILLAVILLVLLAVDLCFAYISLNGRQSLFDAMNRQSIGAWISTYGVENIQHTAWFFTLLFLLSVLVLNTLVCTGDRLWKLIRRWRTAGANRRVWFSLATHIMHLSVVVILIGYLLSYTMTRVSPSLAVVPDLPTKIAGTEISLELLEMKLPVYEGSRLEPFSGRVIQPEILLRMTSHNESRTAWLGFNKPVRFLGHTLFLQNFSPRNNSSMSRSRYIVIDVRNDPGVLFYFAGIIFFLAGMVGVVFFRPVRRCST
ncbi:MAG: hypothetical protein L3J49_10950 [Desulfobulbaceae bacterium]|nr:hypothetical protein [Desulfobulbaceae bacterium]